jgi:hypothetical protein
VSEEIDIDDATLELFSDYSEGKLGPQESSDLEKRFEAEPQLKKAYDEFLEAGTALSQMHKMSAPQDFEKSVEDSIRERSAGRFFGRRAFGDRIPYELLAVILLLLALGLYWLGRSSGTGGYRIDPAERAPVGGE